jgi:cell wall-associated NlpC family hydrolase
VEPLSLADPAHLRAELAAVVEGLLASQPVWYRWGGSSSPAEGLDCSGLVCWACARLSTPLPLGRPNTDALWQKLERVDNGQHVPGDLALYGHGDPADPASHVMVVLAGGRVAGMSGGGPHVVSETTARARGAQLKEYRTHLYRPDFLGFRRIDFSRTPGVQGTP